jgi:thioredoxin 1
MNICGYNKNTKKRKDVRFMSVININKENFNEVKNSEKKVLIDFYADWCGPCQMVAPIIDEIAKENPQYLVGKVNVDEQEELAQQFGVFSIPALVVLENGKVVNQVSGARPKPQILRLLEG